MAFDGTYLNDKPVMTTADPILQEAEEDHSSDATIRYFGKASYGVETSEAAWLILEVTTTATAITKKYASVQFDQEWDEREALTYS